MNKKPQIFCVGSIVWDIIGRSGVKMPLGADRPGKIIKIPGGVALNLAMKLRRNNIDVAIIGIIGNDIAGSELLKEIQEREILTDHIIISNDLSTDTYIAIEGSNGLIGAIADFSTLEYCEDKIFDSLVKLISNIKDKEYYPIIALDGNISDKLLTKLNSEPLFESLDMRIAPASPGKAERLKCCVNGNIKTIYVNLEEVNLILNETHACSSNAAEAFAKKYQTRIMITNGSENITLVDKGIFFSAKPPIVEISRITGAGDVLMASHIQAEMQGYKKLDAIHFALNQTAKYISSSDSL